MTLRTRLFVVILLVVLVPLAIGGLAVLGVVPGAMRQQVETRLESARMSIVSALVDRCARAGLAARDVGLQAGESSPDAAVRSVVPHHADYAALIDESGGTVARAGRLPASVGSTAALPSCTRRTVPGTGAPPVLAETVRVRGQPGLARAIVAYRLDATALDELAGEMSVPGGIALVDNGELVSSTLAPADVRAALAAAPTAAAGHTVTEAGDLLVAVSPPRPGLGHTLVVATPQPDTTWLRLGVASVVVGGLALAVVLGAALARDLTRPLAELTAAAERVSEGELDAEITVRSKDEAGRLSAAFNEMTARIRAQVRALQQGRDALRRSRDALRTSLDRVGDALARSHDLDGILAVVLDTAMSAVDATTGAVYMATPEGPLTLRASAGASLGGAQADSSLDPATTTWVPPEVVPGEGLLGQAVSTGEVCRATVSGTPALAAPLRRRGVVVGVLALYGEPAAASSGAPAAGFTEANEQTVRTLVTQGSVAVENVLLHEQAQRLAITDELTGLWNYRYLSMSLHREIDRAARFDRPLAVLMIDLDHFKQVNDTHGHERGNAVLVELTRRVNAQIREVDTFARYGGEEFCLVLPETDVAGAALVAERLRAEVRDSPFGAVGESPLHLTVSMGAAVFPADGGSPPSLLQAADDALYAAKRAGRDTWVHAGRLPDPPVADEQPSAPGIDLSDGRIGYDPAGSRQEGDRSAQ